MKSNEDLNLFQLIGQFLLFTKKHLLVILGTVIICGALGYWMSGLHTDYSLSRAILKVNLVPTNLVEVILSKANETKGYSESFNTILISGSIETTTMEDKIASYGWNNSDLLILNYQTSKSIDEPTLKKEIQLLTDDNAAVKSYYNDQQELLRQRLSKIEALSEKDTLEERRTDHLRLIDVEISTKNTIEKPLVEILHFHTRSYHSLDLKPLITSIIGGIILGYIIVIIGLSARSAKERE